MKILRIYDSNIAEAFSVLNYCAYKFRVPSSILTQPFRTNDLQRIPPNNNNQ